MARDDDGWQPSDEQFRYLVAHSPMPTVISRIDDGTILFANDAFLELLGYEEHELVARPFAGFDLWDRPEERKEVVRRLRSEGRITGLEIGVRSKDGAVHRILASVEPVEVDGSECVAGVFHDITARARAEAEVERLGQRLLLILAAAGDGIFGLDRQGRCIFVNPAAATALGYDVEELHGQVMHDVIHHSYEDRSPYPISECPATRTIEQGTDCRVTDEVMWRRDGTAIPVEYTSRPIFEDGMVTGAVVVFRDTTEQRRTDALMAAARVEAEQASRAKNDFLSRMSHELRTPLNAILGFGQLLEMEGLDEGQRDSVAHITAAGRHLLELVNEVLDISRIESRRIQLSFEPVRVADVVDEALGMVRTLAQRRCVRLPDTGSVDGGVHVRADRQRLTQVLLNLLSNAVKYNRDGGEVVVRCEPADDERVRLVVTDTGIGIAEADLGRLFLPFERVGGDHADVEGTGLGLALSRRLVTAMEGELDVSSEVGRGSSFSVVLPGADAPSEHPGETTTAPAAEPSSTPGRPRTVLYVEDNMANVKLMERILARRPEVTLLVAMQGSLALELAREHRPTLVFLDLNLPDMSGEELLRRLRADPATEATPVIVISGDATPGQAARLRDIGATDYVTKPFDVSRLLAVVDNTG